MLPAELASERDEVVVQKAFAEKGHGEGVVEPPAPGANAKPRGGGGGEAPFIPWGINHLELACAEA